MNRILNYLGYGFGLLLVFRKEPRGGGGASANTLTPAAEPPSTWLHPEQAAEAQRHRKAAPPPKGAFAIAKNTFSAFFDDDCTTLGASVAYFSVFSLAPLLLMVISIAGLIFGRQAVQGQITGQIQGLIGAGAAEQVQSMLAHQSQNQSGGIAGVAIGIVVLLFGATGAFAALQTAMNKTWHVEPDPARGGVRTFLAKRLLSFGMIIGLVFLLIVSLAVSAVLAAAGGWLAGHLPHALSGGVAQALSAAVSFVIIGVLFALILKVLPDGEIAWRDVWVGGALTSVLFTIGRTAIGLYLGKAAPGSAYGAAGSLVVIVLWLYYASLIVLLGAEFTKVWAAAHGREIGPEEGAIRVVTEKRKVTPGPQHA